MGLTKILPMKENRRSNEPIFRRNNSEQRTTTKYIEHGKYIDNLHLRFPYISWNGCPLSEWIFLPLSSSMVIFSRFNKMRERYDRCKDKRETKGFSTSAFSNLPNNLKRFGIKILVGSSFFIFLIKI